MFKIVDMLSSSSMNKSKLDSLPSECIVLILSHLHPPELDECRLVSRRFHQIIESNVKRLPKYKIETIVKRDSDDYFVHHSLPSNATPKTVPKQFLRKCEIYRIIFDNPDISLKKTIKQWNDFRLLDNLEGIELRGSNWEILSELLGPSLQTVKVKVIL